MPTELNRIRELSGLQQEAEPQGTADDLISTITKLAQDAVEKSNFSDLRLFQAKEREIQELIKKEPNNDALRQIWNYYPSKKTPPKKGGRFGDIDVSQAELQAQHEVIIERLLREIINIGRKHLNLPRYLANFDKSDLTAPQQQGLAALVKKYANRKTYGGGGLIDGYLDYLAQTGVWTDAADEKEFDVALKKLGHKNLAAWEKQAQGEELEQFLGLAPITAQAQNDVEKVLGKGFQNNEELISAASDYVRSLPESAVAEAPASGDQALAKDLANYFKNKARRFKYGGDTGIEYQEMVDIAKGFRQGLDQGMEEINDLAQFEFSAHPFGGMFSNNEGDPEEEVMAILNKHGYTFKEKKHPEFPRKGLVTLHKKVAKGSAAQPVNSSVDDTIQRARAQIESLEAQLKEDYKKFQGMKPYKPKKK